MEKFLFIHRCMDEDEDTQGGPEGGPEVNSLNC